MLGNLHWWLTSGEARPPLKSTPTPPIEQRSRSFVSSSSCRYLFLGCNCKHPSFPSERSESKSKESAKNLYSNKKLKDSTLESSASTSLDNRYVFYNGHITSVRQSEISTEKFVSHPLFSLTQIEETRKSIPWRRKVEMIPKSQPPRPRSSWKMEPFWPESRLEATRVPKERWGSNTTILLFEKE